jgi:hypothetical protein
MITTANVSEELAGGWVVRRSHGVSLAVFQPLNASDCFSQNLLISPDRHRKDQQQLLVVVRILANPDEKHLHVLNMFILVYGTSSG